MTKVQESTQKFYKSWQNNTHASFFNTWGSFSNQELKKVYESFNDIQLLITHARAVQGRNFAELGCATGELYGYISRFLPQFKYHGFDISQSGLATAQKKYPQATFVRCGIDMADTKSLIKKTIGQFPDILFCRDVVLHQTKPFDFLTDLMSIPSELLIMRLRTRDQGPTLLDPNLSCQWNYGEWTPYMILNTDEMIETIKSNPNVQSAHILKHYIVLGGQNNRYLPKDCFYPETGTAETAVAVRIAKEKVATPSITIEKAQESAPSYSLVDYAHKGLRKLRTRLF